MGAEPNKCHSCRTPIHLPAPPIAGFWHDRPHVDRASPHRYHGMRAADRRPAGSGSAHRRAAGPGQAAWPAQCAVPAHGRRADPLAAPVYRAVADPAAARAGAGGALPGAVP
ncbi:MAG: hypothetical protein EPN49_08790 [Rhodanobacter sp.]|nr:MAG: hypothetical protein EPN49_08790 [Rhodanobacter sp.]